MIGGQESARNVEMPSVSGQAAETFANDAWIESLRFIAEHYRISLAQASYQDAGLGGGADQIERIRALGRKFGLRMKLGSPSAMNISSWQLPMILQLDNGEVVVLTAIGSADDAGVIFSDTGGLQTPVPFAELLRRSVLAVVPRPARSIPDARVDAYIRPYDEGWLKRIVLRDLRPYVHVMLASLVANALGLAGMLFSMQVYDRVVPSESINTLYVLFSGVLLAIGFDFIMRRVRTSILDLLGKQADWRMSDLVFGHALRVRNSARPTSTGTFIAQLRDLDQIRELLTSTTVAGFADIPFFLLFLVIYWHIGGILVLVPVVALALLVVPGLLVQTKMRDFASEAMRESSLRNAMLVEAVQGIEDIKTLQAEDRFQQNWNHFNAVTGSAQLRQRSLTSALVGWTHCVQSGVYATTIFIGAPMVISGELTTGALVGISVLGSRMISPMAQITQILSRMQQAKVSLQSVNRLMQMPVDHPDQESRIHVAQITGKYALKSAIFRYGDATSAPALKIRDVSIRSGEKIAVLGKNGAGKSTLLQALSGLLEPISGEVLLDNMALQQLDPADVRREVGLLTQNARLFYGTIRENVTLGTPHASQQEIMDTLAMVGADEFIRKLARGLDHVVLEGGHGLSGGQRQAILLARLLIRQPSVVLLDEPTASMDETTERHFINQFLSWSGDKTVVVATHRMRVLELVSRVMVVDGGAIILDETKEAALQSLRGVSHIKAQAPRDA